MWKKMCTFAKILYSMDIKLYDTVADAADVIFLYGNEVAAKSLPMKKDEVAYLNACRADKADALVTLSRVPHKLYVQNFNPDLPSAQSLEILRRAAAVIQQMLADSKSDEVYLTGAGVLTEEIIAFMEGFHMANYRFDKYKCKKEPTVKCLHVDARLVTAGGVEDNMRLWRCIDECRDWVNEPVMYLNAERFAGLIEEKAKAAGVQCTVLCQHQIEALKMGGLMAVNRGSEDEARFVVLEYKPADHVNAHPVALVGKGIMYDTGGLNLKPDDYMREMKSDMAGAATMATVVLAAAQNHLPVHLMAFLPMTDNRPGKNAYAADDILKMYDGTTVEVVNTDAEGRLILADAIAYSNQFDPELIIDAATLTGAAVRAIGTYGIAAMQQNAENPMNLLKIVGEQVYERIAEFPFWKEYDELIKSDVADVKNCGTAQAGAITAGKFNAHFARHPFIHLDIAGVAYFAKKESFYGVGASGYAVRLLYAFLQTYDALNKK